MLVFLVGAWNEFYLDYVVVSVWWWDVGVVVLCFVVVVGKVTYRHNFGWVNPAHVGVVRA